MSVQLENMLDTSAGDAKSPLVLHTRVVTGSGGGPEKTILNSPRFLEPLGYRSLCVYLRPPNDDGFDKIRSKARTSDAPLCAINDRGPWDAWAVTEMLKLCRKQRVAIWHGHDYKSNAMGLLLRRFWPMRLVTTVHGWGKTGGRTPLYYKIDRYCLRHYEKVLCVSPDLYHQCLDEGVARHNCQLVENAIDTEQYRRRTAVVEAKKQLGLSPDRLLIGAVGRLSEEKGFDQLIEAVDGLIRESQKVDLMIVGEGDEEEHLRALIHRLGHQERVHLLGYRADMIPLYEAMDVYALSSLREGLPNVVLEAMAMEVPVVATSVAGIPRLMTNEQDGLIVPVSDRHELASALRRLLNDSTFRSCLGASGRATIERRYSFAKRMKRVACIYDEILGDKSSRD